jgi:hypothetical protein
MRFTTISTIEALPLVAIGESPTVEVVVGSLWSRRSTLVLAVFDSIGFAAIALGWFETGTRQVSTQVAWVNVAIAGLALSVAANGWWLLSGRRRIGHEMARLFSGRGLSRRSATPGRELVSGEGMRLFHRSDCVFVIDKKVEPASRGTLEAADRQPCAVCEP